MMCLITWLIAVAVMINTVTGWSRIEYNPRTNACSYARDASTSFHYLLFSVGAIIPLCVIAIFYTLLFLAVRRSRNRVRVVVIAVAQTNTQNRQDQPKQNSVLRSRDVKLSVTLFVIFVVFLVCFCPYSLANLLDSSGERFSSTLHKIVSWIFFLNCAVNPVLYALMNKAFREAYLAILGSCCQCTQRFLANANLDRDQTAMSVQTTSPD